MGNLRGKSTAAREFLLRKQVSHIWMPLNESSKNTGYFWSKLIQRISEVNNMVGAILDGLGFPQDSMQTSRIMDTFMSNHPEKDFMRKILYWFWMIINLLKTIT